jgi:two-component system CheB/CheR fusion protein
MGGYDEVQAPPVSSPTVGSGQVTARAGQALFDHSVDAVFLLDEAGRIVHANLAASARSGFERHELIGMAVQDLCDDEDRYRVGALLERLRGGLDRGVSAMEVTIRRKSGRPLQLMVNGATYLTDDGQRRLVCIGRDVTRKNRLEKRLRSARRDAELARDRFMAMLSHELRTPLMPVLTAVQMLQTREELGAELQDSLAMMRRNLELEARLIDDLLDLSRIRRGRLTLYMRSTDVHAKLRHVVELCRHDIHAKRLHLDMDLRADRAELPADAGRVQQVLLNVISNAVKFTPDGGKVTIRTCNGPECMHTHNARCEAYGMCKAHWRMDGMNEFLVVHVGDTGQGFDTEEMQRLFEAFDAGLSDIHEGERGIRLAVSRALLELHGGKLMAYSEGPGRGALFTLMLPLQQQAPAPSEHRHTPAITHVVHRKGRVLLVEDHPDTARVLAHVLRTRGLSVEVAGTVESALALARESNFDLLVSDIGLPDGTGHELLRQLRTQYDFPAIALSGYGMEEDIQRSRSAGFADHLVKPINLKQLNEAIGRLLPQPA